ncbi:hypothetical protein ACFQ41_00430 [Lacticaseibacillus suilingensis]|uniref:ABC transporter permease n=1 Tax=Lacticaseibacillus suilingensis TaxID=2799577 RepID=A0ABW4BDH4_9LACO|nr:hypothetical protein [Lacticaseibacillus suilingensis]
MGAQYRITLKRSLHSVTNLVIAAAFFLLLMSTSFSHYGQQDSTQADLYGAYATAGQAVDKTITGIEKIKPASASVKAELRQKKQEKDYLDQITLVTSGGLSANLDEVNRTVLAHAKYSLRATEKDPHVQLQLIKYQDQPTSHKLIERKKDVVFHTYLYQHHMREIPIAAIKAPAANYLSDALLYHVSPFLIIAVFIVWLAEFFTTDKREGNIDVTNTLPMGKMKVLIAKIGVAFTIALPLFCLTLLAVFVVIGLSNGWGSLQYPIAYSLDGQHAAIMQLGEFLLMFLGALVAIFCFFVMLSALFSLIASKMSSLLVAELLVLLTGSSFMLGFTKLSPSFRFLPTAYFDYSAVILNSHTWPSLDLAGGINVLLSSTLALLGCTTFVIYYRQRLLRRN